MIKLLASLLMAMACANFARAEGDYENGKKLAKYWECFHCHGLTGNQRMDAVEPAVPLLAGQPASYLAKTMKDYRSGRRIDDSDLTRMNARVEPLSDQDIDDIAIYFAAQKRY